LIFIAGYGIIISFYFIILLIFINILYYMKIYDAIAYFNDFSDLYVDDNFSRIFLRMHVAKESALSKHNLARHDCTCGIKYNYFPNVQNVRSGN